ncbi:hypothetical protein PLANPX_1846 [Lacipirellula parvula]|uniref:Uncharacterized protein n=1 Tax=Lacipirellula parvula TaxID=2650471 RepID=A0A5K7X688_9BACT|nr:hypothetical protein PLANPX_1846 [Lacipirellula parvula]
MPPAEQSICHPERSEGSSNSNKLPNSSPAQGCHWHPASASRRNALVTDQYASSLKIKAACVLQMMENTYPLRTGDTPVAPGDWHTPSVYR